MVRKAQAAFEVWGKITGDVDTPQKFEAKRMELATIEWTRMKANGSQECRNCHNFDAMSAEFEKPSNYKRHMDANAAGKVCIDCHKGIAHHLPKEYHDPDED
jgi:cytochrome c-type protein NapC